MRSSSTAKFCKLETCPSAEALLLYAEDGLTYEGQRKVAAHLAMCDFCGAEMQLLERHPPGREVSHALQEVALPAALRRLAEDLMFEPERALARFAEMTFERERLTLTDA